MPPHELSDLERRRMVKKLRGIGKIILVWIFFLLMGSLLWWQFFSWQYYAEVILSLFVVLWFFTGALAVLMVADDAV